ncbi:hypothetical protein D3C77_14910 [compost metagenome]|uniref:DUF1652 domain-containing protein n=1 Tax=Pseudomonas TaxID=286 RepID=UPI000413257B|nr:MULTISPECIES: DUF1652 domain-containing protein [Pseudomonas]MCW2271544.1 hypothetical protein [Pseudomonas sp. JUb96]PRA59469.1 DUF1652 domain-containing protein [Pseudomonas sp. MYb187]
MDLYGLSDLEIKQLIERALLPDLCECSVDGTCMTLNLTSCKDPLKKVVMNAISTRSLKSSRGIAELIGEARIRLSGLSVEVVEVGQSRATKHQ